MEHKILITSRSFGRINDIPLNILKKAGYKVDFYNDFFDQETFRGLIPQYEALIIGGHEFPEDLLKQCANLKLICKHGAGLDNIPLETAKALNIKVCNAPGTNANAVADLTFGLILNLARKISYADRQVHAGQWNTAIGRDVCFKMLGLLGFGAIAKNVARRAKGFEMPVLAYDPYISEVSDEFFGYVKLCTKDEVLSKSQIISAHLPLNENTRHMISSREIEQMRPGTFLVNTSRGGIVDERAVAEGIKSGKLAGAAFDVLEKEPLSEGSPLRSFDNVIITPHIGMYSEEAIGAVSTICAWNAAAFLNGEKLKFQVV